LPPQNVLFYGKNKRKKQQSNEYKDFNYGKNLQLAEINFSSLASLGEHMKLAISAANANIDDKTINIIKKSNSFNLPLLL